MLPDCSHERGFVISSHMQQFELSEKEQAWGLLSWNVQFLVCFVIFIRKEHMEENVAVNNGYLCNLQECFKTFIEIHK